MKYWFLFALAVLVSGAIFLLKGFDESTKSIDKVAVMPSGSLRSDNAQEFPVVAGKCRPGGLSPFASDSSTCDVNASQEQSATQTVATNRPLMVKGLDVSKAIKTLESGSKDNNFVYGELLDECLKPTAMNGTDREACTEILKHRGSWLGKLKVAARTDDQTASALLAKELQLLALDALFKDSKVSK
jgi:hypothetical protein